MLDNISNSRAALLACLLIGISGTALADSPIVRDSVGRVAGYYAGGTYPATAMRVISATGYSFAVTGAGRVPDNHGPADGASPGTNQLYYLVPNCEGQPYVLSYNNVSGFVIRSHGSLMYAPKGEAAVERVFASRKTGGFCQGDGNTYPSSPAYPNDEAVTGVPDVDFVPPIQIVIARDVSDVFRNGYEAPKA